MDGFGGIDAVTDTWYQQFGSWCAILTNHQYIGVWIWTTIIRSHATHQECAIRITPIFEGQWFISVCSLDVLPTKYCLPFEMWTWLVFLEHLVSSISQRTCLFRYVRSILQIVVGLVLFFLDDFLARICGPFEALGRKQSDMEYCVANLTKEVGLTSLEVNLGRLHVAVLAQSAEMKLGHLVATTSLQHTSIVWCSYHLATSKSDH